MSERENAPCFVIDCRWWGMGGAGRVTEWLIRGCEELAPRNRWKLWGPPLVRKFAWSGAAYEPSTSTPTSWFGQRDLLRIPSGDLTLFLHQIRPLRRVPAVSTIYDTIPLRWSSARTAKRMYLKRVVDVSRQILTISEQSRDRLMKDLEVPSTKIAVVDLPVDFSFMERVTRRRKESSVHPVLLYAGRLAPHKNITRLIKAFGRSTFRADGGKLVMVGASPPEARAHRELLQEPGIEASSVVTQEQLEHLFATSAAVVLPSLEEGFGLPIWEAMMCGIPVVVSDGVALPGWSLDTIDQFPADSTDAMSQAIDRAVNETSEVLHARAQRLASNAPDLKAFAQQIVDILGRSL